MIVLETVRPVVAMAAHVSIDDAAIARWAETVPPDALRPSGHELLGQLPGDAGQLANLVFLIDALNFCFWSDDPITFLWRGRTYHRFEALFVSILLAAKHDPQWFSAAYWVEVPSEEIRRTFGGKGELLLADEREGIIRQTGRALIDRFDGQFIRAVESVNFQAWPLAVLLMTNFDSFRDVSNYHGQPIYFMKRAQICALDLAIAWQLHDQAPIEGLETLTAFADYRVPQALRHLGVLRLSEDLAARIERAEELPQDSDEEIEIRAATIEAVDRMVRSAEQAGQAAKAWQIDGYLWSLSHAPEISVNHHRTRTVYY